VKPALDRNLTQTYPGIWRLVANNPSPMTGPGTNTYLVGHKQAVIIDPGPADEAHLANITRACQTLELAVQAVIITHHHSDHSGGARQLAQRLGVSLLGFGDPVQAGDRIEVDQLTLTVQHTPGHIQAHICLWAVEQRLLLAGDLVAGQGTILVIPPDGDMAAYLESLQAMQALNPAAILPGHGPVIEDPRTLLQEYIDHRLMREQQVLDHVTQGHYSAAAIAAQIYADRPEAIGIGILQIEAHLEKLRKEGRV
jgi:hydroxyacylglutathione hydrolase